jgi:CelD/BcsL family acetyltransferase involved in cellulose biosynthesis
MFDDGALSGRNPAVQAGTDDARAFEVVRSQERLREIADAWDDLWSRAHGSLFQSHAWIEAWWRTAPRNPHRDLAVALCWHGGRLTGVLPLVVTRWRGLRVLEWAAKDQTDYCDALLAPGIEASSLIVDLWLAVNRACRFDLVYLSHLLPDAAARHLMDAGGPIRLRSGGRETVSLRIETAGNGAAWFDGLSRKVRKDLRRKQRLLEESGPVRFRLIAEDEPLGPVIDRLAELKRGWAGEAGLSPPLLADDAAALRHLVGAMAASRRLRLFILECGGAIVAGAVTFVEQGRTMVFLITHDPALGRASPGVLLMTEYVRWSFDRGIGTVDFLCGDEGFKARFATARVTIGSLAGARSWKGLAALSLDRAVSGMRSVLARGGPVRQGGEADQAEV